MPALCKHGCLRGCPAQPAAPALALPRTQGSYHGGGYYYESSYHSGSYAGSYGGGSYHGGSYHGGGAYFEGPSSRGGFESARAAAARHAKHAQQAQRDGSADEAAGSTRERKKKGGGLSARLKRLLFGKRGT